MSVKGLELVQTVVPRLQVKFTPEARLLFTWPTWTVRGLRSFGHVLYRALEMEDETTWFWQHSSKPDTAFP